MIQDSILDAVDRQGRDVEKESIWALMLSTVKKRHWLVSYSLEELSPKYSIYFGCRNKCYFTIIIMEKGKYRRKKIEWMLWK